MSKKVKCLNCANCMRWAVPCKKYLEDNTYLINRIKTTLICGFTMKTKGINNEQYCKHFIEADIHKRNINSEERYNSNVDNIVDGSFKYKYTKE